jgi:hypothetical protein
LTFGTVLTILVALLFWLCLGLAVGLLVGRIFRGPGERRPEPREVGKLVDVGHLCEARTRRDVRNGLGKAS